MTREDFLRSIWQKIINAPMSEVWIDNVIQSSRKDPNAPFSDLGPALERLLQEGVSRRELSLVSRFAAYEACFSLLYMLDDPGLDDASMLHESLLGADPSGGEGRPGSAP